MMSGFPITGMTLTSCHTTCHSSRLRCVRVASGAWDRGPISRLLTRNPRAKTIAKYSFQKAAQKADFHEEWGRGVLSGGVG